MICTRCYGGKTVMGMGCMPVKCPMCNGNGEIDGESTSQTNGEQDKIKRPSKRKAKETVDQSTPESCEGVRSHEREECEVGSGSENIQEREAVGKSDEEIGHQVTFDMEPRIKDGEALKVISYDGKSTTTIPAESYKILSSPIKNGEPLKVVVQNAAQLARE